MTDFTKKRMRAQRILNQYDADYPLTNAEQEELQDAVDDMYSFTQEIERLRAAMQRIAYKPPLNEEYGNQGIDADEMMGIAKEALSPTQADDVGDRLIKDALGEPKISPIASPTQEPMPAPSISEPVDAYCGEGDD